MKNRILFVDDDVNLLAGLRRAMWKEPYEIINACGGEDGLNLLRKTPVDVVVSDHQMPGMDGIEFLKRVRQGYPDTIRFMLTGNATLDLAIQAINEGEILRFFTKPCNNVDLAITIRQALQQKKLVAATKALVEQNKGQRALIQRVEQEHPGIADVERDEDGAILIRDLPEDVAKFLDELGVK
jgi:DNA-binding NtrC family response regulator